MDTLAFDKWYVHASTLGPIGRIPKAPGTFGSLPGVLLAFLFCHIFSPSESGNVPFSVGLFFITSIILFSWIVIDKTERYWQKHDRSEIVVDELAGQIIPIVFLGTDLSILVTSFIFFRFFDILKPWPVGYIDKNWPGAHGTLFDDIAAGFLALASVYLLHLFL